MALMSRQKVAGGSVKTSLCVPILIYSFYLEVICLRCLSLAASTAVFLAYFFVLDGGKDGGFGHGSLSFGPGTASALDGMRQSLVVFSMPGLTKIATGLVKRGELRACRIIALMTKVDCVQHLMLRSITSSNVFFGHSCYHSLDILIGEVLQLFPYLGVAGDEKVPKGVLDSLLRCLLRPFRAFVSYFLADHATELLSAVWIKLHLQVWWG